MEISVKLSGNEINERTIRGLESWLREDAIDGLKQTRIIAEPPEQGEMGVDVAAILAVILGSKAIVALVKSLYRWVDAQRKEITLTLRHDGKELTFSANNPSDMDTLVRDALKLFSD